MFPIGSKILCDGYVIIRVFSKVKTLILNNILCDGYVMIGNQPHQADEITETNCKILCHRYVIMDKSRLVNLLIINDIFMSWLCHYWLPLIFNSQAGIFFVPLYCQQKNKTTILCPNNKT